MASDALSSVLIGGKKLAVVAYDVSERVSVVAYDMSVRVSTSAYVFFKEHVEPFLRMHYERLKVEHLPDLPSFEVALFTLLVASSIVAVLLGYGFLRRCLGAREVKKTKHKKAAAALIQPRFAPGIKKNRISGGSDASSPAIPSVPLPGPPTAPPTATPAVAAGPFPARPKNLVSGGVNAPKFGAPGRGIDANLICAPGASAPTAPPAEPGTPKNSLATSTVKSVMKSKRREIEEHLAKQRSGQLNNRERRALRKLEQEVEKLNACPVDSQGYALDSNFLGAGTSPTTGGKDEASLSEAVDETVETVSPSAEAKLIDLQRTFGLSMEQAGKAAVALDLNKDSEDLSLPASKKGRQRLAKKDIDDGWQTVPGKRK